MQDPYSATLGGFSRVTHFLRDTLLTGDQHSIGAAVGMSSSAGLMSSADDLMTGSGVEPPTSLSLAVHSLSEAGFEVVTAVSNGPDILAHLIDSYEPSRCLRSTNCHLLLLLC